MSQPVLKPFIAQEPRFRQFNYYFWSSTQKEMKEENEMKKCQPLTQLVRLYSLSQLQTFPNTSCFHTDVTVHTSS